MPSPLRPLGRRPKDRVFVDVDKTILASDGSLRPYVRVLLEHLQVRGYRVYLWSAAGPRPEVVERHGLGGLITGLFAKPFPLEGRSKVILYTRWKRRLAKAICIDDDPAVIDAFGGIPVKAYDYPVESDNALLTVIQRIDDGNWLAPRPAVSWRYLAPRLAVASSVTATLLTGLLRLLLPAAITFNQAIAPGLAAAASFGTATGVATPDAPLAVFAAKIDGDADYDIVATIQGAGSSTSKVVWYSNASSGTSWTENIIEADFSAEGGRAQGLSVVDVDLDGDMDVFITDGAGLDIYWYENDGAGSFTRATVVENSVDAYYSIVVADINDDDFPDVIAQRAGGASGDEVVYLINQCTATPCDPTWGTETFIDGSAAGTDPGTATDQWRNLAVSDLDADGFMDVVAGALGAADLIWFENPCTTAGSRGVSCTTFGSFTARVIDNALGSAVNAIFVANIGSDSDRDILVALNGGTVDIFYNQGGAPLTWSTQASIVTGLDAGLDVIATKIDADGDVDLVTLGGAALDDLEWYSSDGAVDGSVAMTLGAEIDNAFNNGTAIGIGDFNGDGALDVLAAAFLGDDINWYAGTDTPSAVTLGSFLALTSPTGNRVQWRSSSELNVIAYRVYRREREDASWEPASPLILARNTGGVGGAAYEFADPRPASPASLYLLQELLIGGRVDSYGPVSPQ